MTEAVPQTDTVAAGAQRFTVPFHRIAAVAAGNALEFYDFLTFSFFTVQISHAFFPGQKEDVKVLSTLLIFGAGFLTRPLGAFVIGRWGDRSGRKPAMFWSFTMMGAAIVGLALTPPRAMIGVAAPILFLCFRLIQGFALGGVVGPTTAYLFEVAPPEKRGLYVAVQFASQDFAVLVGGIVGTILSSVLSSAQLDAYGWRIAFLLGAFVVPFALVIRRKLPETLVGHESMESGGSPGIWRLAILGVVMLAAVTITNYVNTYMTTFAENTLHVSAAIAFGATVGLGLSGMCFDLISGVLSDRYGRKPIMTTFGILFLLSVLPVFYAIVHLRSAAALLVGPAILGCLQGLYAVPIIVGITEGLPHRIRSGALGLIYAFGISIFGGTTQFIVKGLLTITGNSFAPAGYMMLALSVGVIAMFFVRETAPARARRAQ